MIRRLQPDTEGGREHRDDPAELIVGIDLGTTNSEVAVVVDGSPRVVEEGGGAVLPSAVGLDAEGRLLVGDAALNQMLHAPERTVRSIKRRMGSDEKVRLGDTEYTPQEISSLILRRLKERAEVFLGKEVQKAVITVPAFFNDAQRRATREAGELAGLEVVRILHEPTAASLVYEADHYRDGAGAPRRILVYDMGGGTFDVSVVELHDGVVNVLASHGDTHLGGDDFDGLLLEHVAERFRKQTGVDLTALPQSRARLLRAVEAVKRRLSFEPFVSLDEEFIAEDGGRPLHLSLEISRDDYESMIRPLIERSMSSVQAALHDAKLLAREIDLVVLVGGSTRTPLVQRELAERTKKQPRFEVDPDLCVALGAASQGALIAGRDVRSVLVDITPHSLGIRCLSLEGDRVDRRRFGRVIRRGTALPARRSEVYYTCAPGQETVRIEVYQGEDPDTSRNTKLGDFVVNGLSEDEPPGSPIVVDFELSLDGTLRVTAREKRTGTQGEIVIEDGLHSFDEEERDAARGRLERFFAPERDRPHRGPDGSPDTGVGELPDEHREILGTTGRLEGLLGRMVDEDREETVALINRARERLEEDDIDGARKAHEELRDILFYVEEN